MPSSKFTKLFTPPLLLAALAGCGSAGPTGTPAGDVFPMSIGSGAGRVTIAQRPARIVSLSPTSTEDLFAVGAGGQVVAVDSYSDYPANAPKTKLSGFQPNLEAIAGYKPDLVVVADDTNGIAEQLAKLGVPVLVEPAAPDLTAAYAQIGEIGRATGHSAQAATVVSGLRQKIAAIVASVPKTGRTLTVYHELDQTYFSATSQTFIGQAYRLLGLRNIADSAPGSTTYPQLSSEYVISANPDLIVLADTDCCAQTATTVRARAGWSAINAVKNGAVVGVKDAIASQWGPRIAVFLQAIVDELTALHRAGTP